MVNVSAADFTHCVPHFLFDVSGRRFASDRVFRPFSHYFFVCALFAFVRQITRCFNNRVQLFESHSHTC